MAQCKRTDYLLSQVASTAEYKAYTNSVRVCFKNGAYAKIIFDYGYYRKIFQQIVFDTSTVTRQVRTKRADNSKFINISFVLKQIKVK